MSVSSVQKLKIDTMVADERKIFVTVKEDLEQCIDGILKATVILLKKNTAERLSFSSPMLLRCTRSRAVRGFPSSAFSR